MAQTLDAALLAASRAVQSDKNGQYKQALYYYDIAVKLLTKLELDDTYEEKLSDYRERMSSIQHLSKFDDNVEICCKCKLYKSYTYIIICETFSSRGRTK